VKGGSAVTTRIAHYLLLAAVLVGVPLACCVLGGYDDVLSGVLTFPPRTEDFGFHPEKLWNFRRPFSWSWFLGMALFTAACLFPFARRAVRALFARPTDAQDSAASPCVCSGFLVRFPLWGWFGLALLVASWVVTWNRFPWFASCQVLLSYFPVWTGYILSVNALCQARKGTCPLTAHPLAYLLTFPVSSLFWWFFEYLNRFVWNWYYVGIDGLSAATYALYATLCFASVLPAVAATAELLGTFRVFDDRLYDGMMWRPDVRSPVSRLVLALLSLAGLTGIVFLPDYAFPLLWISPLMVFVLVQVTLGERSVLDRLKDGAWGLIIRFEAASLVCGLCWETWNYYALAKWVYAVPWVHAFQVWEMPLIGFAGYLPFGVECAAVTFWVYDAFGLSNLTDDHR